MPAALLTMVCEPVAAGGAPGSAPGPLVGRELRDYEELRAAAALYVDVFKYRAAEFALNPNLLSALSQNGGSAVGVFTPGERLVGFAYGFAGRDAAGTEFHYSQAATVDPAYQGRGVGRTLKLLQAEVAERWGHHLMRWTFDPVLARNAHFNFDTLGARGVRCLPDYYARPGTDRILVEWGLDRRTERSAAHRADPPTLGRAEWGESVPGDDGGTWIALPSAPPASLEEAAGLRARLTAAITGALAAGGALVGCTRIDDETAAYLAMPARGRRHDEERRAR